VDVYCCVDGLNYAIGAIVNTEKVLHRSPLCGLVTGDSYILPPFLKFRKHKRKFTESLWTEEAMRSGVSREMRRYVSVRVASDLLTIPKVFESLPLGKINKKIIEF
jgi:hypothetical protein